MSWWRREKGHPYDTTNVIKLFSDEELKEELWSRGLVNEVLGAHEQAMPIVNDKPIVQLLVIDDLQAYDGIGVYTCELIISDIHARLDVGIARYGTGLQPFNGRDALRDAYEEAVDLVMYLKQLILENGSAFYPSYMRALSLMVDIKVRMP